MNFSFDDIKSYTDGKAGLIVGLCEQIGVGQVFDKHLTQHSGRPADISYGTLAQMMLVNMADDHHPLSRLNDYFENVDLETLFNIPINRSKINDDRFGGFLDSMQNAGCGSIMSDIAVKAFTRYGIKLTSANFDTTSKVMWGKYETDEGLQGAIDITFGHSKQKRQDKKQIKFSMGTTQGICFDGQVLSGNLDDKSFNVDNLDHTASLKERFNRASDEFFYIADSAAFTKDFLEKAKRLGIHIITRMPDNVSAAKAAIEHALDTLNDMTSVEMKTSTKPSKYLISESICEYHDTPLKMAVCYSKSLEKTKRQTVKRGVIKERATIDKLINRMSKRNFACETDAQLEITKIQKQDLGKLEYHTVAISIDHQSIKRQGRPSKNPENNTSTSVYHLMIEPKENEAAVERKITKECIFVVVSTALSLTAEEILKEYKTQSAVERKFQFLKSLQFVNSLYVESPKRVEALGYLMLILLLILSIAEHVVRRELATQSSYIIGPGKVKMPKPSLIAIYRIFYSVITSTVTINGQIHRGYNQPLKDNVKTVMRYLGIPESLFIRGSS